MEQETITTDTFPPKPVFEAEQNSWGKSLLSIVLFIAAGYLFFGNDLSFVFILVVVLFIHEMGHFAAMKYFGYSDVKMFFVPLLGAYVSGEKQQVSQRQRAIVLLMGPVPGILIGVLLYVIAYKAQLPYLIKAANMFLFINAFNLLPFVPLDGGNLINTLYFTASEIVQVVFMLLSAAGLVLVAFGLESYLLLVLPFILIMQVFGIFNNRKLKKRLDEKAIEYNKAFEELSDREYWLIRDEIVTLNNRVYKDIPAGDYTVSSKESNVANAIKSVAYLKPIADLSGWAKFFYLIIWLLFLVGAPLCWGVFSLLSKGLL